MKKIVAIIAVLILFLTSCDSGIIIGGRYFGTFNNLNNGKLEAGDLSFKYTNKGGETYFLMNGILPLGQVAEKRFEGSLEGNMLRDLLKTMPAIDGVQVCDSTEAVRSLTVDAEFKGNSVKSNLIFTTTNDNVVTVEFIGGLE